MDAMTAVPYRHPWLDRLIAAPEEEVLALAERTADIDPFRRAEPSDAAATLLFGLSAEDPAVRAFDQGTLQTLVRLRSLTGAANKEKRDRIALAALDLITVVQRLAPRDTTIDLHRRFLYWNAWAETLVLDRGLDLRREYWRTLALTQDEAKGAGSTARRFLPFWLDICNEAGRRGRYDESYLTVGLIGLRSLPLVEDDDSSNEEAALFGLARWANAQQPEKRRFLREWHLLEGAFPRDATYWTDLVARVLASLEEEITNKSRGRKRGGFLAADWWREDVDAARGIELKSRAANFEPPPREAREKILKEISDGNSLNSLEPRINALMQRHEQYATRTGDTFYMVRTACNIGRQLLQGGDEPNRRAAKARELATLALRFEGSNVFSWALWRDSLAAEGQMEAAELIGWETIRRYPENPQWRNQLALLLADRSDRIAEAEALLRETIELFSYDQKNSVVARTQLANIVGRDAARIDEALAIIGVALKTEPDDQIAIKIKTRFEQGKVSYVRELTMRNPSPEMSIEDPDLPADLLALGRMRRTLFRARAAAGAESELIKKEIEKILNQDENLAYARYVAAATGVSTPVADDSIIAAAYLAAARDGSMTALRELLDRAHGVENVVLLMAGKAKGDEEAARALDRWIGEPANDFSPRDQSLRDMATGSFKVPLSSDLVGDMLAASLEVTILAA